MGDRISMSISVDNASDETFNRGPLALLLRQKYEFLFGINLVHFIFFLTDIVTDRNDLRSQLQSLWFTPYARHGGSPFDSSGFEHVMVGEYKSSTEVNGLHNWLAYYYKERVDQINYLGYVGQHQVQILLGHNKRCVFPVT